MKILLFLLIPLLIFSQNESIKKMKMLPKIEFDKAFNDSIVTLKSLDLWNFILSSKESGINLNDYNANFIIRLENAKWANEIHFLIKLLIEQNTEKIIIENVLNNKSQIWDKGEWSEKFWLLIRENNFSILKNYYFDINEKGEKKYNIKLFFDEKIKNNEIGVNPLLKLNYSITDYPENQILKILEKLNIKDIQIISKENSILLFGKRGIDGMIQVLTK